jgi:hypothetical protein
VSGIKSDFRGAFKKTDVLKTTPKALRFQATRWAAETVKMLKRSAASMKEGASMGHGKTGALARAVGMKIVAGFRFFTVRIGTGVSSLHDVKYAKIQDEGGTVNARNAFFIIQNIKDKPRHGPFLTVPLRGVKGRVSNYPGAFAIRTKTGKFLIAQSSRQVGAVTTKAVYDPLVGRRTRAPKAKLKMLFVLKRSVKIPASYWFTNVIDRREQDLAEMMDPEVVYNIASQMAGGGGA